MNRQTKRKKRFVDCDIYINKGEMIVRQYLIADDNRQYKKERNSEPIFKKRYKSFVEAKEEMKYKNVDLHPEINEWINKVVAKINEQDVKG